MSLVIDSSIILKGGLGGYFEVMIGVGFEIVWFNVEGCWQICGEGVFIYIVDEVGYMIVFVFGYFFVVSGENLFICY